MIIISAIKKVVPGTLEALLGFTVSYLLGLFIGVVFLVSPMVAGWIMGSCIRIRQRRLLILLFMAMGFTAFSIGVFQVLPYTHQGVLVLFFIYGSAFGGSRALIMAEEEKDKQNKEGG